MRPRFVEFFVEKVGAGFFMPDYAFLQSVAIVLGFYLVIRQAEQSGLEVKRVFRVCLIVIVCALLSARIYIVIRNFSYYVQQPQEILQYWKGGTASFGAYIGGFLAAVVAAKWQRISLTKFLDACAPAVALAITIGRLGCFLNGCCFGRETNLPWALRFPEGSGPYYAQLREGLIASHQLSLPVHPTQLYEAIYALVIFFILLRYRKAQKHDGELFALLFIVYPLGRFLNEFLRGDERGFIFVFSLPQFFSLIAFILAVSFVAVKNYASRPMNISTKVSV